MADHPLSVGVVGLGNMGKNHLRVLSMLKSVDIRFVHDSDPQRLAEMAAAHNVRGVETLPGDFEGVDALFVLTPTSTHAGYVEQALGKVPYLFVEKPLTGSGQETHDLVKKIEESGTSVQVGYIERFNPATQVLKNLTRDGKGIINIDLTRTSKASSRIRDVSVVTDLMIHDIDLALHLNGAVDSVVAFGLVSEGFVVFASATFVHRSGSLSRVLASRITEKKRRLIEMTCMDKFVSCDLLRKEIFINKESVSSRSKTSYIVSSKEETVLVSQQEALLNEINSFVEACGGNDFSRVPTALDDMAAMDLAEQIQGQILERQ